MVKMLIWNPFGDSQHLLQPMDSATAPLLIVFCTHGIQSLRWHRPITWLPSLGSSKSFKLIIPSWEACCWLTPFPSTTACLFNSQLPPSEDQRSSAIQVESVTTSPGRPHAKETTEQEWRKEDSSQFIFTERFHFHLTNVSPKKQYFRTIAKAPIDFFFFFCCKYRNIFAADCRKSHQHVLVSQLSTILLWSLPNPLKADSKHFFALNFLLELYLLNIPSAPLITLTNMSQSD